MNLRWIEMTGAIVAIAVLCLPAISAGESPAAPGVLVIDDFEGYSDEEGNRIYETWIEWRVPLSKLVGVNFSKVREFYLGVDDRSQSEAGWQRSHLHRRHPCRPARPGRMTVGVEKEYTMRTWLSTTLAFGLFAASGAAWAGPLPEPTAGIPQDKSVARRVETPPNIDGDLSDWEGAVFKLIGRQQDVFRGEWSGPDDLTCTWSVRWDDTTFYFAAAIRDDVLVAATGPDQPWTGDAILPLHRRQCGWHDRQQTLLLPARWQAGRPGHGRWSGVRHGRAGHRHGAPTGQGGKNPGGCDSPGLPDEHEADGRRDLPHDARL